MKNKNTLMIQWFCKLYFVFCSIACVFVTLLPFWPTYDLLIIPKYALLFGPRWWLLASVLAVFLFWVYLSKRQIQFSVLLVLLSLNYLDFQLPKLKPFFLNELNNKSEITVLSANIGGGGSKSELSYIAKSIQPDILLLQEARKVDLSKWFTGYPFKECLSGLCIVSKYPFEQIKKLNRNMFSGWGLFAVFYQVTTKYGIISLANVHFETPRSVLMGVIHRSFDFDLARTVESNRQFEAELVSLWSKNKTHTLVAGDFNMPADENIYNDSFSDLNNAVDVKGIGFNATKHTSWHGTRIDHILYSNDFKLLNVGVVDSMQGDHSPVFAKFTMSN